MRTTYVTLLGVLAAAAAATPAGDDGNVSSFHCWTEADGAIRCQWSKTYAEARVVYSKTFDRDTEPLDDCRPDDQLTTATQVGCTTKYANAFIRYTLRLVDADNHKIWQIDNFVGQNYRKYKNPLFHAPLAARQAVFHPVWVNSILEKDCLPSKVSTREQFHFERGPGVCVCGVAFSIHHSIPLHLPSLTHHD